MTKRFWLSPEQIKPLTTNRGACLATDRITVDGAAVTYMYREKPDNTLDCGWRFFAGDETDAYLAVAENSGVYDVNTIANYAPDIVPLLDVPAPCAFERDSDGAWIAVTPTFEA